MDVLDQPVDEVGQGMSLQFAGESVLDVAIARDDVLDGLRAGPSRRTACR